MLRKPQRGIQPAARRPRPRTTIGEQEQAGEALSGKGTPLIGAGTNKPLLAGDRLAQEYGGDPEDWAKMGSGNSAAHGVQTPAGGNFETHWYQNVKTGQVAELKTKITGH